MSLILKGIDLPKDGDFIALEIHKGEYRIYYTKGATIREKRGEAIQILKGHEKILDSKYLLEPLTDLIEKEGLDPWCEVAAIIDLIEDAPYYLEAEEADENQI